MLLWDKYLNTPCVFAVVNLVALASNSTLKPISDDFSENYPQFWNDKKRIFVMKVDWSKLREPLTTNAM